MDAHQAKNIHCKKKIIQINLSCYTLPTPLFIGFAMPPKPSLSGKRFFFDFDGFHKLKRAVIRMGGKIEAFLDKNVQYLVTNQRNMTYSPRNVAYSPIPVRKVSDTL